MLNNSTLKRTFLIGFVLCMFAAACSDDGGRGEQPAAPDTTVTTTTTTEVVEEVDPTTTLEVVVVEPEVDDTTTTSTVTTPPVEITEEVLEQIEELVVPDEIEELLREEPVVVTAPPTTAPPTTEPPATEPEPEPEPAPETPTTTMKWDGPWSDPIIDSGMMWTPDNYGFDPEQNGPSPQAVSDPVYLVPGMLLNYQPDHDHDHRQNWVNGAVVTKIIFYEKPQRTSARICINGTVGDNEEWSLRLARTDTPDEYHIVYSQVYYVDAPDVRYNIAQVSSPNDAEPC